jgi:glutamate/tyrosine decarboxylase-like PLP-dependent enzyme
VLDRFTAALGMDPDGTISHFTTGGAEANLTAVLAALARAYPGADRRGLAGVGARPTIYLTEESHHSFVKIARMCGLGTDVLRPVRTTSGFSMDVADLADRIASDRGAGAQPLMIVATAGTTGTGAVDALDAVADVARDAGTWFHVDAAWGGSAVLAPRLRRVLTGIARADSVTWDAHKWLSVPMGAGMFFCRHGDAVRRAFSITTSYMPGQTEDVEDPYRTTVQWSRRAIGLKVFLSLAELGLPGYGELIDRQARMGDLLRARLEASGWVVVNDTPLPVICFTRPEVQRGDVTTDDILATLNERGRVWISQVTPAGAPPVLRACITSYRTDESDIACLVEELEIARDTALDRRPSDQASRTER